MKIIAQALDRFWFIPAPPERIALLRIFIGAYGLAYLLPRYEMFMEIAASDSLLFSPVGAARILENPMSAWLFQFLLIFMLAMNVCFMLGWKRRYTGPIFGVLLLWVLSYRNSWSMIYHSDNLLVFHVLILGFTRSADALSLDSAFGGHRSAENEASSAHWRYNWPILLICSITLVAYFLAGFAKVMGPLGWAWASGESLMSQVAVDVIRKEALGSSAPESIFILYGELWLFTALGVGTLLLELGTPAAILHRRLGSIWALSAFLMHWGIFFIMEIKFRYQLTGVAFLSFFALESALYRLGLLEKGAICAGDNTLLFDGECTFCNGVVRFIIQRDARGRFKFASLQSERARQILRPFGLGECGLETMVLIENGRLYTKSDAALRVARELSGLYPLIYPLILAPKPLRDLLYSWFARRRYRWFGRQEVCPVPDAKLSDRFLD
ncbi:MAG: DCC1-like thiol-disulfide oxidoreductase family protein [Deltaproteobacteria bacterium]